LALFFGLDLKRRVQVILAIRGAYDHVGGSPDRFRENRMRCVNVLLNSNCRGCVMYELGGERGDSNVLPNRLAHT
jgi:hypothetical protein